MRPLQSTIKNTIGWCLSLGTKIITVTPFTSFTVQLASLSAQILLLLTFFLPLKVLILLGSDAIPHYYPLYLKNIKKAHLITGLSILALACFILYLIAELTIFYFSREGAKKLLKKSAKLNLFNNQKYLATQIYSKFNRGLSAGIFSILAFAIIGYIYPTLFLVACAYLFCASWLITALYNNSRKFEKLLDSYNSAVLNTASAIGFLIVFFCMITNFLYFAPPKIFAALISLLLMRQALSRLTIMIQSMIYLRVQHRQINALFFHGQQLTTDNNSPTNAIKNLLEEANRNIWSLELIRSFFPTQTNLISNTWHQLGNPEIYAFEVVTSVGPHNSVENKRFLIKLFSENVSLFANKEKTLISSNATIPSLPFCGSGKVENLTCHVFELGNFNKVERQDAQKSALIIHGKLISIAPLTSLVKKFSRSHLFLEQRLSSDVIDQLKLIASTDQIITLNNFQERYNDITKLLCSLPRQIVCLDINQDTLLSDCGEACVSHWANWKMEPVGSNWPISYRSEFKQAIDEAKRSRLDLINIVPAAFMVSALTYAFERFCSRSNYVDAMNLLPEILEQLDLVETSTNEPR